MFSRQKHRFWIRTVSLLLIETMIYSTNLSYGDDEVNVSRFNGRILEQYKGTGDKVVIHIKDAHCNFDAQDNICSILKQLSGQGFDIIGLEGAEGKLKYDDIISFPDKDAIKEVSKYFVKNGMLSGSEYFVLNYNDNDAKLIGVEDKQLYLKNYQALIRSLDVRKTAKQYCQSLNGILKKIKTYLFDGDLADIDKVYTDYLEEKINFYNFSNYLNKYIKKYEIDMWLFENYNLMLKAHDLEKKIDFETVNKERARIVDLLVDKLPKEKGNEILQLNLGYKLEQVKPQDFHQQILNTASANNVDLSGYKEFHKYLEYLNLYEKIDMQELFDESGDILSEIKKKLYVKEGQADLDKFTKIVNILENFFDLKLSPKDLKYYIEHKEDFKTGRITSFIEKYANQYQFMYFIDSNINLVDNSLPLLEDFYTYSKQRDKYLVDNLLAEMELEGSSKGVLVTGGFHTEGMMKLLKEKGISYYVVSPVIHQSDDKKVYISMLMNEKSPFEQRLENLLEQTSTLAVASKLGDPPLLDSKGAQSFKAELKGLMVAYAVYKFASSDKDLVNSQESIDSFAKIVNNFFLSGWAKGEFKDLTRLQVTPSETGGLSVSLIIGNKPFVFTELSKQDMEGLNPLFTASINGKSLNILDGESYKDTIALLREKTDRSISAFVKMITPSDVIPVSFIDSLIQRLNQQSPEKLKPLDQQFLADLKAHSLSVSDLNSDAIINRMANLGLIEFIDSEHIKLSPVVPLSAKLVESAKESRFTWNVKNDMDSMPAQLKEYFIRAGINEIHIENGIPQRFWFQFFQNPPSDLKSTMVVDQKLYKFDFTSVLGQGKILDISLADQTPPTLGDKITAQEEIQKLSDQVSDDILQSPVQQPVDLPQAPVVRETPAAPVDGPGIVINVPESNPYFSVRAVENNQVDVQFKDFRIGDLGLTNVREIKLSEQNNLILIALHTNGAISYIHSDGKLIFEQDGIAEVRRDAFSPDRMQELQQDADDVQKLLTDLNDEGFIAGRDESQREKKNKEKSDTDDKEGALKDIGDEDAAIVPGNIRAKWDELAGTAKIANIRIEGQVVQAKLIVDNIDMPAGLGAYHFYDNSNNLIIVVREDFNVSLVSREAIYHELREVHWMNNLSSIDPSLSASEIKMIAHILAAAEEVALFGQKGVTPYHRERLNRFDKNKLWKLLTENRARHSEIVNKYLGADILVKYTAYQEKLKNAIIERMGSSLKISQIMENLAGFKVQELTGVDSAQVVELLMNLSILDFTNPDDFLAVRRELTWWAVNSKDAVVKQNIDKYLSNLYKKLDSLIGAVPDENARAGWQIQVNKNKGDFYEMGEDRWPQVVRELNGFLKNTNIIQEMLFIVYGLKGIDDSKIQNITVDYLSQGHYKQAYKVTINVNGNNYAFILKTRRKEEYDFQEEVNNLILSYGDSSQFNVVPNQGRLVNEYGMYFFTESFVEGTDFLDERGKGFMEKRAGESDEQYINRIKAAVSSMAQSMYFIAKNLDFKWMMSDQKMENVIVSETDAGIHSTVIDIGLMAKIDKPFYLLRFFQMLFTQTIYRNIEGKDFAGIFEQNFKMDWILEAIVQADPEGGLDYIRICKESIDIFLPNFGKFTKIANLSATTIDFQNLQNDLNKFLDNYILAPQENNDDVQGIIEQLNTRLPVAARDKSMRHEANTIEEKLIRKIQGENKEFYTYHVDGMPLVLISSELLNRLGTESPAQFMANLSRALSLDQSQPQEVIEFIADKIDSVANQILIHDLNSFIQKVADNDSVKFAEIYLAMNNVGSQDILKIRNIISSFAPDISVDQLIKDLNSMIDSKANDGKNIPLTAMAMAMFTVPKSMDQLKDQRDIENELALLADSLVGIEVFTDADMKELIRLRVEKTSQLYPNYAGVLKEYQKGIADFDTAQKAAEQIGDFMDEVLNKLPGQNVTPIYLTRDGDIFYLYQKAINPDRNAHLLPAGRVFLEEHVPTIRETVARILDEIEKQLNASDPYKLPNGNMQNSAHEILPIFINAYRALYTQENPLAQLQQMGLFLESLDVYDPKTGRQTSISPQQIVDKLKSDIINAQQTLGPVLRDYTGIDKEGISAVRLIDIGHKGLANLLFIGMLSISDPSIEVSSYLYNTSKLRAGPDWAYRQSDDKNAEIIEVLGKMEEYSGTKNGSVLYKTGDIILEPGMTQKQLLDYHGAAGINAFLAQLLVIREAKFRNGEVSKDFNFSPANFEEITNKIISGGQTFTQAELNTIFEVSAGLLTPDQKSVLINLNNTARGIELELNTVDELSSTKSDPVSLYILIKNKINNGNVLDISLTDIDNLKQGIGEQAFNKLIEDYRNAVLENRYKAAVFDLDGTLAPEGKSISPEMKARLKNLLDKGVPVAIITGRNMDLAIRELEDIISPNLYLFVDNGAYGIKVTEPANNIGLDPNKFSSIINKVKQDLKDKFTLEATSFGKFTLLVNQDIADFKQFIESNKELKSYLDQEGISLKRHAQGLTALVYSNKGTAVDNFASRLGLSPKQIAKFGDSVSPVGNDYEMIARFGGFNVGAENNPFSVSMRDVEGADVMGAMAVMRFLDKLRFDGNASLIVSAEQKPNILDKFTPDQKNSIISLVSQIKGESDFNSVDFVNEFINLFFSLPSEKRVSVLEAVIELSGKKYSDIEALVEENTGNPPFAFIRDFESLFDFFSMFHRNTLLNNEQKDQIKEIASKMASKEPVEKQVADEMLNSLLNLIGSVPMGANQFIALEEIVAQVSHSIGSPLDLKAFLELFEQKTGYNIAQIIIDLSFMLSQENFINPVQLVSNLNSSEFNNLKNILNNVLFMANSKPDFFDQQSFDDSVAGLKSFIANNQQLRNIVLDYLNTLIASQYNISTDIFINRFDGKSKDIKFSDILGVGPSDTQKPNKNLARKDVQSNIDEEIRNNIESGNAVRISLSDLKTRTSDEIVNDLFEGTIDQVISNLQNLFAIPSDKQSSAQTTLKNMISDELGRNRVKNALVLALDVLGSSNYADSFKNFTFTMLLDYDGAFYSGEALAHVGGEKRTLYMNLSTLIYASEMSFEDRSMAKRVLQAVFEHEYRDWERSGHKDDIGVTDPVYFQNTPIKFSDVEKFWVGLQNRDKEQLVVRQVDGVDQQYWRVKTGDLAPFDVSAKVLSELGIMSAGKFMALLSRAAALEKKNLNKLFGENKVSEVLIDNLDTFQSKYKIDLKRFSEVVPVGDLDEFKILNDDQIKYKDQLKALNLSSDFFIVNPVFNLMSRENGDLLEKVIRHAAENGYLDKLLIVDDASTDGTRDLLIDLKKKYDFNLILRDENGHRTGAIRETILGLYSLEQRGEIKKLPEKLFIIDGDSWIEGRDILGQLKDASSLIGTVDKDGNRVVATMLPLSTHYGALPFWKTNLTQKVNYTYLAWLRALNSVITKSVPGGGGGYSVPYLVRALQKHSGVFETDDGELSALLRENKHTKFKFFARKDFRVITDMPETLKNKWNQSRRWSGGMFQVLRKYGKNLPPGMAKMVIFSLIAYTGLGIALPICVVYPLITMALTDLSLFIPLGIFGAIVSYLLYMIPMVFLSKDSTWGEKAYSLIAPIMGVNFIVFTMITSFYEYYLTVWDFAVSRPFKYYIKPAFGKFNRRLVSEWDGLTFDLRIKYNILKNNVVRRANEIPALAKIAFAMSLLFGFGSTYYQSGNFLTQLIAGTFAGITTFAIIMVGGLMNSTGMAVSTDDIQRYIGARFMPVNKNLARKKVQSTIDEEIRNNIESGKAIRVGLAEIMDKSSNNIVNAIFNASPEEVVANLQKFLDIPQENINRAKQNLASIITDPIRSLQLKEGLILALDVLKSSKYKEKFADFTFTLLLDTDGAFHSGEALSHVGGERKTIYMNLTPLIHAGEKENEDRDKAKRILEAVFEHEYRDWKRGEHKNDIGFVDPVLYQGKKIKFSDVNDFWNQLEKRQSEETIKTDGSDNEYLQIKVKGLAPFKISSSALSEMDVITAGKFIEIIKRAVSAEKRNILDLFGEKKVTGEIVVDDITSFSEKYNINLNRFSQKLQQDQLPVLEPLALGSVKYADQLQKLNLDNEFFIIAPVYNLVSRDDPDLMEKIIRHAHEKGYLDKVVFVDDASKDGTQDVLKKFNRKYNLDQLQVQLDSVLKMLAQPGLSEVKKAELESRKAEIQDKIEYYRNPSSPVFDFNMVLRDKNARRTGAIKDLMLGLYSLSQHGKIKSLPEKAFIIDGDSYLDGENVADQLKNAASIIGTVDEKGKRIIGAGLPLSNYYKMSELKKAKLMEKVNFVYFAWMRAVSGRALTTISGGGGAYSTPYLLRALNEHSGQFEGDDAELSVRLKQHENVRFKFFSTKEFRVVTDMPQTIKGLWKQARRWSGPIFYLLREQGRNTDKYIYRVGLFSMVVYTFLAVQVASLAITTIATGGIFNLVIGGVFFTALTFLNYVIPILFMSKDTTFTEKAYVFKLLPMLTLHFLFLVFLPVFYEYMITFFDLVIARPANYIYENLIKESSYPATLGLAKNFARKEVRDQVDGEIKANIENGKAVRIPLMDIGKRTSEDIVNDILSGSTQNILSNLQYMFDLPQDKLPMAATNLKDFIADPLNLERMRKGLVLALDILSSSQYKDKIKDFSFTMLLDFDGAFYSGEAISHVGGERKTLYMNLSTLMHLAEMDPDQKSFSKQVLQAVFEHEYRDWVRGAHTEDIGVDPVYFQNKPIKYADVEKFWNNLESREKEKPVVREVNGEAKQFWKIEIDGLAPFLISSDVLYGMGIMSAGKFMALLSRAAALQKTNLKTLFGTGKVSEVIIDDIDAFQNQYKLDIKRFSSRIPVEDLESFKVLPDDQIKYKDQLKSLKLDSDFFIVNPVFNLMSRENGDLLEKVLRHAQANGYLEKILIVDDASTDGTADFLRKINRRYNIDKLTAELAKIDAQLMKQDLASGKRAELEAKRKEVQDNLNYYQDPRSPVYDFNMVLRDENGHRTGAIRETILGLYSLEQKGEIKNLPQKLFIIDGDSWIEGRDILGQLKDAANLIGDVDEKGNRTVATMLPLSTHYGTLPFRSTSLTQKVNYTYLAWLRALNSVITKSVPGGGGGYSVPYLIRALQKHSGIFETDDAELSALLRSNPNTKFKFFARKDFRVITDMPETLLNKWKQSRRWSGGIFQVLRKYGRNLPPGMLKTSIMALVLYTGLGIALPIFVVYPVVMLLLTDGLAIVLPLGVFGLVVSALLYTIPMFFISKDAGWGEKSYALLAPLMGLNFFIFTFVASFVEYYATMWDFLAVRPAKFIYNKYMKPVFEKRPVFEVPGIARLKEFLTIPLSELTEVRQDLSTHVPFFGLIGAIAGFSISHMARTNIGSTDLAVNFLFTVAGMGFGAFLGLLGVVQKYLPTFAPTTGHSKLTHNGLSYIHRRGLTIFYGKGTLAG